MFQLVINITIQLNVIGCMDFFKLRHIAAKSKPNHKEWNRELTLKCKLKCYVKTHWMLALVKGFREPHEVKKKLF